MKTPKIKIGLVQINNSFSDQDYLPYSIGLLQAFAQKYLVNKDDFEFLLPVYKRIPVKTAVESLLIADMVFFSVYVWNFRISCQIARQIKKDKPQTVVVFGGPQVPDKNIELFLRLNPFVDITCHGEGELAFKTILENYNQRSWKSVPSIAYIENGKFIHTPAAERISDLNKIPSPYLEGVFEPLMKANPKTEWLGLWETNRGCPFLCAYCDWGSTDKNKVYAFDIKRLFKEIDWFSRNEIEFIFCCDANFAILERDIDIVKHIAENKRRLGYPKALSVQSTKNFKEYSYKIYKTMSNAGLSKGVSLSLQSLNEETLKATKRKNIVISMFKETQEKLASLNIETFTDIILGLPNETYETFAGGVSMVIENGQHNRIQFNNLSILPNAEMSDPEYQKRYGLKTVETKLINIHGSLADTGEVYETQQLVVATSTMPKSAWAKTRVFGWMTALLHCDKLLQVPFIILHKLYNVSYRDLIELFISSNLKSPILSDINSFFAKKAAEIQNGGPEFCESKKWLNIWWPADELLLIDLCAENKLAEFYKEAEKLISRYLQKIKITNYETIVRESMRLNKNLIKLPFQKEDMELDLSYNIWDVYYAALRGVAAPLKNGEYCYRIDRTGNKWPSWEDWCREVIWYGNKKGAYIYNVSRQQKYICSGFNRNDRQRHLTVHP